MFVNCVSCLTVSVSNYVVYERCFFFLFSMYIAITSDIRFVIRILPDLERMEAAPVAQASSSRRQLGLAALAVA